MSEISTMNATAARLLRDRYVRTKPEPKVQPHSVMIAREERLMGRIYRYIRGACRGELQGMQGPASQIVIDFTKYGYHAGTLCRCAANILMEQGYETTLQTDLSTMLISWAEKGAV